MTGNLKDAILAVKADRTRDREFLLTDCGSSRTVYLINGVVYKVDQSVPCWYNTQEFENINTMRDSLPEGIYFPNVELFEVFNQIVIAMDYIEGQAMAECHCLEFEECDPMCMSDDILKRVKPYCDDTGGLNVIETSNGDLYIIDAA